MKENNIKINKYVGISDFSDLNKLINIQLEIEKNRNIKHIRTGMHYHFKDPDNHIELLNHLIIRNISNMGFVSVSKVIKDFIEICTSENCNINLSLSQERCIAFIKDSIKELNFDIINSYQRNSKHTILQFRINIDQLDQLHFNLPMITTPRDWMLTENKNNAILGGYLHNELDVVKLINSNHRLNSSDTHLTCRLISLINKLHKIKFNTNTLTQCYEAHKKEFKSNTLILENMSQNTKYEKSLYYMFMDEYITHNRFLIKSYEDFIKIINENNIKYFHLLYNVCFRGRVYASGLISPTSDKKLRRYLHPHNYKDDEEIIEMDASASVLQILATISCSIKLASISNILDEDIDTWSHIQDLISRLSIQEADSILINYFSHHKYKAFSSLDIFDTIYLIDRNIVKYSIMRIIYGSNPYQISNDFRIEYSVNKLSYKHITLIYATFFYHFKDEIDVLKIIKMINRYTLKQYGKGIFVNNNFISYENTYYKNDIKSIKFRDNKNKIREVEVYLKSPELDKIKSCNASCPNLFHSIDSEICLSIIEEYMKKEKFIFTIHDAFIVCKSDRFTLINYYNQFLYKQHDKLINLIESHINKIKFSKNDLEFINGYLDSIKLRKVSYTSNRNKMLKSKFTLKENVTREYHTSVYHHVNNKEEKSGINTYTIDLKSHVNEIDTLLNLFADKLLDVYPNYFIPGYLQIYSQHIQYIGGANLRVSTPIFRLDQIHDCIEQFKGRLEHYGTSSASYIPIVQSIKFSHLNEESLSIIIKIEEDINASLRSKPEEMSNNLWLNLEQIVSKIDADLELPDMGMSIKTKNNIFEHINYLKNLYNINTSKVDEMSTEELKYLEIVEVLKMERNKPVNMRNRKIINAKRTLANYYVRKFNFTKRHYYTNKDNPLGFYDNEIDYNQIYSDISDAYNDKLKKNDECLKNKYGELLALRIIDKRYINPKEENNKIPNIHNILTADFETIIVNGKHYVFCSSICFTPNKRITKSNSKEMNIFNPCKEEDEYYERNVIHEFSRSYINIKELNKDLTNIEELSNKVLLNFWNDLSYIINKRINRKTKAVTYFHNMDKFDGIFILKLIALLLDTETIKVENINIIQRNNIIYEIKVGNICIRDSLHLLPGSLSNLSKTFLGDSKKDIDIKFTYESIINNIRQISEYCDHDAYLLFRILRKFKFRMIQLYKIDPISVITISALSFRILRTHYIKYETIKIENSSNDLNKHEFILQSYRGGFSAVFNPIEEKYKLTHIDINSSYPNSMTLHLPVGLGMWLHDKYIRMFNQNLKLLNRDLLSLFGFFDVRINVKEIRSISPLIMKHEGKLTDVTGEVRITIFSEELKFIMLNGGEILEIYAGIIYDDAPVLRRFALELYNKRISSKDETEKIIYKLILNSAYGRFALKDSEEQTKVCTNEQFEELINYRVTTNDINLGEKYKLFILHKTSHDEEINIENKDPYFTKLVNSKINYNALRGIQIASAIAAYSRINLLQTIFNIEDKGYKVYYADTDSIYTDMPADEIRGMGIISDKLGDWKIEGEELRGIFIQSKFYLTQKRSGKVDIKLKSIPKDAVRELENDERVWEIFLNRLKGMPINIKANKYFLRNVKEISIDVRLNIQYMLQDKSNLKREPIYNKENEWISTKSYKLIYNSTKMYKKKYSVMKNYDSPSNIESLKININYPDLEKELMKYVVNKLKKYDGKIPLLIKLYLSSYNLSKYEIMLMLSKGCEHLIRVVIALDFRTISSPFVTLNQALDFISETEEVYKFHHLKHIMLINRCENNDDITNVILNSIESSLSKIDQSEILPEDIRIMMQLFMKVIKTENLIEGFELYYKKMISHIEHILERNMEYLGISDEYRMTDIYNMIRMFLIDRIIKGFLIKNNEYSKIKK